MNDCFVDVHGSWIGRGVCASGLPDAPFDFRKTLQDLTWVASGSGDRGVTRSLKSPRSRIGSSGVIPIFSRYLGRDWKRPTRRVSGPRILDDSKDAIEDQGDFNISRGPKDCR